MYNLYYLNEMDQPYIIVNYFLNAMRVKRSHTGFKTCIGWEPQSTYRCPCGRCCNRAMLMCEPLGPSENTSQSRFWAPFLKTRRSNIKGCESLAVEAEEALASMMARRGAMISDTYEDGALGAFLPVCLGWEHKGKVLA